MVLVAGAEAPAEEARVAAGKAGIRESSHPKRSPIVDAIARAESRTSGEIQVHLTRRLWEPKPMKRAWRLFAEFGMERTRERNAVLLYVNLRRHRFAVVADQGIHAQVGPTFWNDLASQLTQDFHSTHFENAIAHAVESIGDALARHFPAQAGLENSNELPDTVTEDA